MVINENSFFRSFWMGGFEGADHINGEGRLINMNSTNAHYELALSDYRRLMDFNIRTVRESIGWRLCEKDGEFDFSILDSRLQAANQLGIQIMWTFFHYGWPKDIDPYSIEFIDRFVEFSKRAVDYLAKNDDSSNPVYSLFNEISFACWTADSNIHACPAPMGDKGETLKQQMVKASIEAIAEIRKIQPKSIIMQCEPLIYVGAPDGWPGLELAASNHNAAQYEVMDMLYGRMNPELGGFPECVDIIGLNYYHNNQWGTGAEFHWHLNDSRRKPLSQLLLECNERYGKPMILAETSHVGTGRGDWIKEVTSEVILANRMMANIQGVCLYPILDRTDWDNEDHWHRSGLWDIDTSIGIDQDQGRVLVKDYADSLLASQSMLIQSQKIHEEQVVN